MRSEVWTQLLDNYIETAKARAFEWGVFDCVTFAANWKAIATGIDPIAEYRGTYSTERQALELIVRLGWGKLDALATRFFGDPEHLGPKFAGRGDIVFAREALGISLGSRGAFLMKHGLAFIPAREFQTVWKV